MYKCLCHTHSKEVTPSAQRIPPVLWFVPIFPGPVGRHHWFRPGSILFSPSLRAFIHVNNICPEASLLQAEQSHVSQNFLMEEMVQSLHQLCSSSLNCLQLVSISFVLRSLELDTIFQMWPHQRWAEGRYYFSPCTDNALPHTSWELPLLQRHFTGSWSIQCPSTLLVFFYQAAFLLCVSWHILFHGLLFPRYVTLHFPCWTNIA